MRIRRNKRGYYERDDGSFTDWLLLCVVLGIAVAFFTFRIITSIF